MKKKVIIAGGSGYLAASIVRRLQSSYELTLADVINAPEEFSHLPSVRMDITDPEQVIEALDGNDAVVNTVALVRERFDKPAALFSDVMVKGMWHIADGCVKSGVNRIVNISSIIAMGWPSDFAQPHRVGDPPNFGESDLYYCISKHLGEQVGYAYHQAHGLEVINIRPGVIDGDGLNAGPVVPEGPIENPWFVYVDPRDIAQAVELSLEADQVKWGTFNIVAGRCDSLFDWTEARDQLGYQPEYNWPEIPEKGGSL